MSSTLQTLETGVSLVLTVGIVGALGVGGYYLYKFVKGVAEVPGEILSGFKTQINSLPEHTKKAVVETFEHPLDKTVSTGKTYVTSNIKDIKSVTTDFSVGHAAKFWVTHFSPIALPYQFGRALGLWDDDSTKAVGPGDTATHVANNTNQQHPTNPPPPPRDDRNIFEKAFDKIKSIF